MARQQNLTEERWSELRIEGRNIDRRTSHSAAILNNRLYVYGGYDIEVGILSDFHSIDLSADSYKWIRHPSPEKHPVPRRNHTLRADPEQHCLYLFGGQINPLQSSNTLYVFNTQLNKWCRKQVFSEMQGLDSHQALVINKFPINITQNTVEESKYDRVMLILGGYHSSSASFNEQIYKYSLTSKSISIVKCSKGSRPKGRTNFACSYNYKNMCLYLFGGYCNPSNMADLWQLNLNTLSWSQIVSNNNHAELRVWPQPRRGHSMVCYNDNLFIFGGIQNITNEKNDVYIFNTGTQTWTKLEEHVNQSTNHISDKMRQKNRNILNQSTNIYCETNNSFRQSERRVATQFEFQTMNNYKNTTSGRAASTAGIKECETKYTGMTNYSRFPRCRGFTLTLAALHIQNRQRILEQAQHSLYYRRDDLTKQPEFNEVAARSMKKILQENRQKNFRVRKQKMLKELEDFPITLNKQEEVPNRKKDAKRKLSPVSEAMAHALSVLGNQARKTSSLANSVQPTAKSRGSMDTVRVQETQELRKTEGKKPCARDGQSCVLWGDYMVIMGGDRHMMSFHDIFLYRLANKH